MQYNDIELQNITQVILRNQFNLVDYPKIIIVESRVLYYQTIRDINNEKSQLLKVLILNIKYWEDESLLHISKAIEELINYI